jgi:fatty acid/phospholipid biosynthesis enzyme
MDTRSTNTIAKSHYTLNYGLRLDKGTASELTHPRVPIVLPDGSVGNMTLHVMNGTADEIKAQLLDSIDAFFDIYADVYGDVSSSTI